MLHEFELHIKISFFLNFSKIDLFWFWYELLVLFVNIHATSHRWTFILQAIPVSVDHSDDNQVERLFERIKTENDGRLDVCVNNAYAGVSFIQQTSGKKFYLANPAEQWDAINGVGLRNHFLCTVYASRMMVERKNGLIVNVSSPGGLR